MIGEEVYACHLKVVGCRVEYVYHETSFPESAKQVTRTHTLRFVKTPRGRRKNLLEVTETYDDQNRLLTLDIESLAKMRERNELIREMDRRGKPVSLHARTHMVLEQRWLGLSETVFIRFDA